MKSNHTITTLLIVLALGEFVTVTSAQTNGVPRDFTLYAEYGAGYSPWKSWNLTIPADGQVMQEVYSFRGNNPTRDTNYFHLAKEDVVQLVTCLERERFGTLSRHYSPENMITDNPTLVVRSSMFGKSNEVMVYAPSHLKDKVEVQRFLRVWNEVLRKVPSPNAEQKPQ